MPRCFPNKFNFMPSINQVSRLRSEELRVINALGGTLPVTISPKTIGGRVGSKRAPQRYDENDKNRCTARIRVPNFRDLSTRQSSPNVGLEYQFNIAKD